MSCTLSHEKKLWDNLELLSQTDPDLLDILNLDAVGSTQDMKYEGWKDWEARLQDPIYDHILYGREPHGPRVPQYFDISEYTLHGLDGGMSLCNM
jgi:hypothetical protein